MFTARLTAHRLRLLHKVDDHGIVELSSCKRGRLKTYKMIERSNFLILLLVHFFLKRLTLTDIMYNIICGVMSVYMTLMCCSRARECPAVLRRLLGRTLNEKKDSKVQERIWFKPVIEIFSRVSLAADWSRSDPQGTQDKLHDATSFVGSPTLCSSVTVVPMTRFPPDPTNNPVLDLAHVGYRLATLSALPSSVPVSRVQLADAGFYYGGQGDEVICYRCHAKHSRWTCEDKPFDIHRRISPQCPHVVERESQLSTQLLDSIKSSGNETQEQNDTNSATYRADSECALASFTSREISTSPPPALGSSSPGTTPQTTCSRHDTASYADTGQQTTSHMDTGQQTTSYVDTGQQQTATSTGQTNASPVGGFGGCKNGGAGQLFPGAGLDLGGAVYPMYQDMASRRRSFQHWDDRQAPPLDQVILSGMFYAGYADCVRCFYCGVGLKHWEVTDDVWVEHVRWRPSCGYLRAVKGDDWIRRTLARLQAEARGEDPNDQDEGKTKPGNSCSVTSSSRGIRPRPGGQSEHVADTPQAQSSGPSAPQSSGPSAPQSSGPPAPQSSGPPAPQFPGRTIPSSPVTVTAPSTPVRPEPDPHCTTTKGTAAATQSWHPSTGTEKYVDYISSDLYGVTNSNCCIICRNQQ